MSERSGLDRFVAGADHEKAVRDLREMILEAAVDEATMGPCWLGNPNAPSWHDCPKGPHRGPEGPNEDLAQCWTCGAICYGKRPSGQTFGDHLADCSLPIDHESYCEPGGSGHPASEHVRG